MVNPIYIMVTNFDGYWDDIPREVTYPISMIPGKGREPEKIIANTQTIFIKINDQTKKVEKAWKGSVYNFSYRYGKIFFKVNIEKEITPIPPEYSNYKIGWHIYESEIGHTPVYPIEDRIDSKMIDPPFFDKLKTTTDWPEFENLTFLLLKLLGIHEIYRYEKQRGTADGFFKFKDSVVIYDCTLESDFEKAKETQISNFCDQLKHETLRHELCVMDINKCHKQVWIITRGPPRMINKRVGDILVKEVSVDKIVQIYRNRLENNSDENTLENQLRDI